MLSRRRILQVLGAAATASLLPPFAFAELAQSGERIGRFRIRTETTNIPRRLDIHRACQRFDVFLDSELPTMREMQYVYSGPMHALVNNHAARNVATVWNEAYPDMIGDVLRKCGGEPDWVETAQFRAPWYASQMSKDDAVQPRLLMCPLCASVDVDVMETGNCWCRNCPAQFVPFPRDVAAAWWKDSDWPIPLVITKCGHRFWWCEDEWVVDLPVNVMGFERQRDGSKRMFYLYEHKQIDKYALGPPDDTTWAERISYGTNAPQRFEVVHPDTSKSHGAVCVETGERLATDLLTHRCIEQMETAGVAMGALYAFVRVAGKGAMQNFPSRWGDYIVKRTDWLDRIELD